MTLHTIHSRNDAKWDAMQNRANAELYDSPVTTPERCEGAASWTALALACAALLGMLWKIGVFDWLDMV